MAERRLTDAEIQAQLPAARARTTHVWAAEPRADVAVYDTERDVVLVKLKNGCLFGFPPALGPGLDGQVLGQQKSQAKPASPATVNEPAPARRKRK